MKALARTLGAVALSAGLIQAVYANEPEGAEAARTVIQSQLDALQNEAVVTAYEFAAPNIKRIFRSPEVFGRMVQNGYPMIWNPAETEFLDAIPRGELVVQRLRIVNQEGVPFIAEYAMIEIDGEWRIAGVEIKKDNSYGV